ncbi:DUF58 domain-containing protein [Anaerobacillus sp. CMMVII]|uniref:DUF58 domain-containing protein n=1 Tax=Anaerobacillus sp. CMMVII TaxID=2755588 RepID=UPI0021B76DF3|nr:DUF58 domain-containing protein [Anaerobacillus sp. CMMVII]MCT8136614.1 DUF58 domain-containing protein [Anaerobacillus sp. CMMVII]
MRKYQRFFKLMALPLIAISTFVYAMFQGGFVSWFLFYSTSLVLLTTLIYALVPIGNVEVSRKVSAERLVSGEDLRITITLSRRNPFPFFFFIVEDVIPEDWKLKNKHINSKQILYPSFDRNLVYSYTIRQPKRGEYQFSKVRIRTSDLFGLFNKEKVVSVKTEVVVYPSFQELNDWDVYNENEAEAYITSQRIIEDVTSVAGSREYVPGDRLTSIDWKVTARINKLMTKEFEEYLGQRFLIALDCSIKDKGDALVFEKAVELATSFTVHSYKQHYHLGLLSIGKDVSRYQIHYGENHQASMLEHLAKLNFHLGNVFDFVFVNEINKITSDTILVIVTTRITDAMVENVRRLKKKRVQTAFCFVTGSRKLTSYEQSKLALITKLNVPYYVIGKNSFQVDLQGGEAVAQES